MLEIENEEMEEWTVVAPSLELYSEGSLRLTLFVFDPHLAGNRCC